MNNTVTNAALNMLHIINEVKYSMKDVLDDVNRKLTSQQQQLFSNLNALMDKLVEDISKQNDKIDESLSAVSVYLSNTIISSKEAHVTKFNFPQLIKNSSIDRPIELAFIGTLINNPDNFLTINGKKVKPTSSTALANQLKYIIPKAKFIEGDKCPDNISYSNIELHCFYKKGFIFKKKKEKIYKLYVRLLPNNIGKATIKYKTLTWRTERKEVTKTGSSCTATGSGRCPFGCDRGRCDQVVLVTPDQGWLVDTEITPKVANSRNSGGCAGNCSHNIAGTAPEGVRLAITCWTHSGRDNTCTCSSDVRFTQKRQVEDENEKSIEKEITFLNESTISLSQDLKSIGSVEFIIKNSSCEGGGNDQQNWVFTPAKPSNDYIKIEFDESKRQIIIRPNIRGIY